MNISDNTRSAVSKYKTCAGEMLNADTKARTVSQRLQEYRAKQTQLTADAYQIEKADIPAMHGKLVDALTDDNHDLADRLRKDIEQAKLKAAKMTEEAAEAGLVAISIESKSKILQSERGSIQRERVEHLKQAYTSVCTDNPVTDQTTLGELRILYAATTDSQKMVQSRHAFGQFVTKLVGGSRWDESKAELHKLMGLK